MKKRERKLILPIENFFLLFAGKLLRLSFILPLFFCCASFLLLRACSPQNFQQLVSERCWSLWGPWGVEVWAETEHVFWFLRGTLEGRIQSFFGSVETARCCCWGAVYKDLLWLEWISKEEEQQARDEQAAEVQAIFIWEICCFWCWLRALHAACYAPRMSHCGQLL